MQPMTTLLRMAFRSYSENAAWISFELVNGSDIFRLPHFQKKICAGVLGDDFYVVVIGEVGLEVKELLLVAINQVPVQDIFHRKTKRPGAVEDFSRVCRQEQPAGGEHPIKYVHHLFADVVGQIIKKPGAIDVIVFFSRWMQQ